MSTVRQALSKQNIQAKVTMAFILMLALSGLENLVAEIIPELEIGPLEIGISSFFFVFLILPALSLLTPLQKGCDKTHPNCTLLDSRIL